MTSVPRRSPRRGSRSARRLRRWAPWLVAGAALVLAAVLGGAAAPLLAGAAAAIVVALLAVRVSHRLREVRARRLAERVLELVYDDWVRSEAERGQDDLERWRRTHRD